MRLLVYGAGAVGGFLGGMLAASGCHVQLVGRADTARRVADEGIRIALPGGRSVASRPGCSVSLGEAVVALARPDAVILAVKAYDTPLAAQELAAGLPATTMVLTIQNGVGNEDLLAGTLGPGRVLAGAVTLPISAATDGTIVLEADKGGIAVSPVEHRGPSAGTAGQLADALGAAGLRGQVAGDYRSLKWSKLLLNILGNATSAILNLSPQAIFRDPAMFAVEQQAVREALGVMGALGVPVINLPGYPVRLLALLFSRVPPRLLQPLLWRRIAGGRGEKMPSLWIDLQRRRQQSEVEMLNGAVAYWARQLGRDTPVNAGLTRVLSGLARQEVAPARYDNNPKALRADLSRLSAF